MTSVGFEELKETALELLNTAYSNESDPHEVACGNAAAITHALLANAEQQRIANLLSAAALDVTLPTGERVGSKLSLVIWLQAEAMKALGVDREA